MWPNPQFPADLVTFKEIRNGKLHFLSTVLLNNSVKVISQHSPIYSRYWMKAPVIICAWLLDTVHISFKTQTLFLFAVEFFAFVFIHLTGKINHYVMQKFHSLLRKVEREPIILFTVPPKILASSVLEARYSI